MKQEDQNYFNGKFSTIAKSLDEILTAIDNISITDNVETIAPPPETSSQDKQECKVDVDAIVKAVASRVNLQQANLVVNFQEKLNVLQTTMQTFNKKTIDDSCKELATQATIAPLKKSVGEAKEKAEKCASGVQRIENWCKVQDSSMKVSEVVFYCVLLTFILLLLFFGLCIWANIEVIHSKALSTYLWLIGGLIVLVNAAYIGVYRWWNKKE